MAIKEKKELNQYSPELKKYLEERVKKLSEKGLVKFQLLCGRSELVPSEDGTNKMLTVYPRIVELPSQETIIDFGTEKPIRIGAVARYDNDDNPVFYLKEIDGKAKGYFTCNTKDVQGMAWVYFLLASSMERDNPNRDPAAEAVYYAIDEAKASEKAVLDLDEELEANNIAKKFSGAECIKFASAMGWDENEASKQLLARVRLYAKQYPAHFLEVMTSDNYTTKADIKQAITKGLITYDTPSHSVRWAANAGGGIIAKLDKDGKPYLDSFSDWLGSTTKGPDTLAAIKKLLKDK